MPQVQVCLLYTSHLLFDLLHIRTYLFAYRSLQPVSYTHLDVYKRQIISNLSGANSHAVCVLALSLKKQATAIKTELFIFQKVDQTSIFDRRSILLNNNLLLSTQHDFPSVLTDNQLIFYIFQTGISSFRTQAQLINFRY